MNPALENIKVGYLQSARPVFEEREIPHIMEELSEVLRSGQLILGQRTERFEGAFAAYCGTRQAVTVNSCTTALQISLSYFGVKGHEVIVPTNTFVATANAVVYAGGTPLLVDIDPESLCISAADVLARATPRVKGVIAVHVGGRPTPDIAELRSICQERGWFLIEDAAHAHGATLDGRKVGSMGDAGCFSFYPTKVMTTGTGGMITTDDDNLAEYARTLRHHGAGADLNRVVELGNDWLMTEMEAVLGWYQLQRLDQNLARRNAIARLYDGLLADSPCQLVPPGRGVRHSFYKYQVIVDRSVSKSRLIRVMNERHGVPLGTVYDPPCHLQPLYRDLFGFRPGDFPVAEKVLPRVVALPMHVALSDSEVEHIARSFVTELNLAVGFSNPAV